MEYTKSEVRKAIERIKKILKSIGDNVPYIRIENGFNLMRWSVVQDKLKELNEELSPLKDHIIDNDDYTIANKLNDLITPVWNDYCTRANNGDFDTHKEAYPIQAIISDLREWIVEYEEERPKQPDTPTESPLKKEEIISRTIKESELGKHFNAKFKGAGNNPNYFNNLVADLKDLSTKNDCSAVALMIWDSKTGFINSFSTFAKWCRFFFDCIGVEVKPNYNYSRKVQANDQLKKKFYYL